MSSTTYMTASELSQAYQSVLKPTNKPESEISQVTSTDDKYEVKLSIHNFEPEELTVKVIDRYVHVEGRHEEKNDKIGFFTRQFTRRYFLPDGAQPESIRCTYSVDTSILTVTAPIVNRKPVKEIVIPIVIVGQQPSTSTLPKHRDRDRGDRDRDRDPTPHKKDRDREREREVEREQSRERHQNKQHLHHLLQQQQSSTTASVTATSSSTTSTSKKQKQSSSSGGNHHHHHQHHQHPQQHPHQHQHQHHRNHHHNHHNEPPLQPKDTFQHQMNF